MSRHPTLKLSRQRLAKLQFVVEMHFRLVHRAVPVGEYGVETAGCRCGIAGDRDSECLRDIHEAVVGGQGDCQVAHDGQVLVDVGKPRQDRFRGRVHVDGERQVIEEGVGPTAVQKLGEFIMPDTRVPLLLDALLVPVAQSRIEEIAEGSLAAGASVEAIEALQAAIMVAVMIPTMVAATTVST